MTTAPGFSASTMPPSPNSTVSVCAALTTTTTATSLPVTASAGLLQAVPPASDQRFEGRRVDVEAAHRMSAAQQ
ncbi:MAG: hypothetical protein QM711_12825 [Micropruina sp.]